MGCPGADDLGREPVAAVFSLLQWCGAVRAGVMRVCAAGEEERSHVGVCRFAGAAVMVFFDGDGVPEQGPAVPVVVLDIVSGVEKVTQEYEVLLFDGLVRRCDRAGRLDRRESEASAMVGDIVAKR
ncbi:hypothetical protein GCM10022225_79400 [Plantactinospora mayteni]